jgi:hypothetical protein
MLHIIILFTVLLIALFFFFYPRKTASGINEVVINDKTIKAEIANNPYSRYRGLSGREELCADCGMLFVFPQKANETFVMRNMKFALDIIWISDNEIIKIDKNLVPEGAIPKNFYSSGESVDYVLEVNGGFADGNNIKAGDLVKF